MKLLPRRRWLRVTLLAIAAFLLLLVGATIAAFHSEAVFRVALDAARPFIPGKLAYTRVDGTLAGPILVRDLDYSIAGTRIEASAVDLDFAPFALLHGAVSLNYLDAADLAITLPPPGDDSGPSAKPRDILHALALPVHLAADAVHVERARLLSAGGETLLELASLDLALDWDDSRASVTSLDAKGPLFDLAGNVLLALDEAGHTSIDASGSWRNVDFPLSGTVHASGNTDALELTAQLEAPAQLSLEARVRDLLDAPAWQGRLVIADLQPSAFDTALPAARWQGELRFDGNWNDTRVAGQASGGWPPATGIEADFDVLVNSERLRVDRLQASVAAFGATLDARGDLEYANTLAYTANGNVTHFAWPGLETLAVRDAQFTLQGDARQLGFELEARAGSKPDARLDVDGELTLDSMQLTATLEAERLAFTFGDTGVETTTLTADVSGTPQNYRAALAAGLQVDSLPAAALVADIEGNTDALAVDIESLRWLDGTATGRLQLGWREAVTLDARLQAQEFELATLDPVLAGRVGAQLHATAIFDADDPVIDVKLESLRGDVAGSRLQGSGALRFAGGRLSTPGLDIRAGDTRLHLVDSPAAGFDFRLEAPELGALHPELGGQVMASGHLEGSVALPTLDLELDARELAWRDWHARELHLRADIPAAGTRESSVRVDVTALESPRLAMDTLAFELKGNRDTHRATLHADGGVERDGLLDLEVTGTWNGTEWRGDIAALRAEHAAIGVWQLDAPPESGAMVIGGDVVQAPEYCLHGPGGHACIGPLYRDAGTMRAAASLRSLPVGVLAGLLPPGLVYAGEINGDLELETTANGLEGLADFRLGKGGVTQPAGEGAETLLGWEAGRARVEFAGRTARGTLAIDLLAGDRIDGNATLRFPVNGKAQVDASLATAIDNLELVPSLVPELSELQGRITAELRASGPLDAPSVRGEARLHDGSARILALGTDWRAMNATLRAEGRALSLTGRAESGEGHIEIDLAGHDAGKRFAGKATLTGENFKAVKTPEADVNISPRLNLELRGNDLYIDGEVFVPRARITPRDLSTATQASPDQVIVNAGDGAAGDDLKVHTAVTVRLGDDVRVNAFGLAARLEGRLAVAQQPHNPATGNGRLVIAEGKYKAYGQDLTLAKGELVYTGQPLSNPGLDIRAEREPQTGILVGVAVRGPLSQPSTSVYSEPPMPQTEALSWLLFGRSMAETTGAEAGQINEAAIALGLGGQRLLGNVGRKLGVEEFRVEEISDRERASLVLGKYLSPDLYISYGIGLFDAVNTARIRYRISSKWMLEATSGLKSSADFIYTIER